MSTYRKRTVTGNVRLISDNTTSRYVTAVYMNIIYSHLRHNINTSL